MPPSAAGRLFEATVRRTVRSAVSADPLLTGTIRVPQDQPTVQAGIDAAQEGDLVLVHHQDKPALYARIEAIDWVDAVIVRRRWPGTLFVRIVEQVPAARWGDDGLLNTRGELFVEHGLTIKRRSPFPHTAVAELTNDMILYQPTAGVNHSAVARLSSCIVGVSQPDRCSTIGAIRSRS